MENRTVFELDDVSFLYSAVGESGGIRNVSLSGAPGNVILLVGESGSGKSTVTKLLNGLVPHYDEGTLTGRATVCGMNLVSTPLHEISLDVGSVFQNPKSQFFTTDTTSELAFSCENQGIDPGEIRRRISKVAVQLEVGDLLSRNIFSLSGGEKQRIACASASTIEPQLYVLDEPTANLDKDGIARLGNAIATWKADGKTVVVAEHRIFYLRDVVDRVVLMSEGRIAREMTGDELRSTGNDDLHSLGLRCSRLERTKHAPVASEACEAAVSASVRSRRRRGGDPQALSMGRFSFPRHGVTALIGSNGAGKSALCHALCGLSRVNKAQINMDGVSRSGKDLIARSYLVMQDVNHELFCESVLQEVLMGMGDRDLARARMILDLLGLEALEDRHPLSLSGGQKQRCAIAAALASQREMIIYDEPTSGLDLRHMNEVADVMRRMQREGLTQIVVTHDPELIEECCTHVIEMEKGRIARSYDLDDRGLDKVYRFFTAGH